MHRKTEQEIRLKKKSGVIKMGSLGIYLGWSSTIGLSNICIIYVVQLKTKQKIVNLQNLQKFGNATPNKFTTNQKLNFYIAQENNSTKTL